MAALIVAIWPSYRETLQNLELPPAFEAFLGEMDIATPEGFLAAEFYSWIPILLIVYAIIQGTGAVAGEEGGGTMDLLLAQPVSRASMLAQKIAAFVIGLTAVVLVGEVGFVATVPFIDIGGVTVGDTLIASLNMIPVTLLFYGLSLWAGSVAPSRGVAAGALTGIVTVAYFVYTISNGVESLAWLKYATPFYYYGGGEPLRDGFDWPAVGLLLGLSALLVAAAFATFQARDVSTGASSEFDLFRLVRRRASEPAAEAPAAP
jgi:ABC-2 type transport system permease protein